MKDRYPKGRDAHPRGSVGAAAEIEPVRRLRRHAQAPHSHTHTTKGSGSGKKIKKIKNVKNEKKKENMKNI